MYIMCLNILSILFLENLLNWRGCIFNGMFNFLFKDFLLVVLFLLLDFFG